MSLTEKDLAAAGVTWLEEQGWTISHEVTPESALRRGARVGRADTAGRRDSDAMVAEFKLGLGLELLSQLFRWVEYANLVYGCVPAAVESDGRLYAYRICRKEGFGLLEYGDGGIVERIPPKWRKVAYDDLVLSLYPEHQDERFARAGSQGGEAPLVTPLNRTLEALRVFVIDNPGTSLFEAVSNIKHHYGHNARAVAELAKLIHREKVPGVYTGWKQNLFPTRESARTGMVG